MSPNWTVAGVELIIFQGLAFPKPLLPQNSISQFCPGRRLYITGYPQVIDRLSTGLNKPLNAFPKLLLFKIFQTSPYIQRSKKTFKARLEERRPAWPWWGWANEDNTGYKVDEYIQGQASALRPRFCAVISEILLYLPDSARAGGNMAEWAEHHEHNVGKLQI